MSSIDFTNCESSFKLYGGAEQKRGIVYDNDVYMLKFPKKANEVLKLDISYTNNIYSEYLGSHIFSILGFDCQDTVLGRWKNKEVVACKDFESTSNGYKLYEFNKFKGTHIESVTSNSGNMDTNLYEILEVLDKHDLIQNRAEAKEKFWDMFIIDALVGNFDRHNGNWGFLVNEQLKDVKFAPIYDCGSCLYARLSDEQMEQVLSNEDEIYKRVYDFPQSAIKNENGKINYYNFITSLKNKECNSALMRMQLRIDLDKINEIIREMPVSEIRKKFYEVMLSKRKELIIDKAYEKLIEKSVRINKPSLEVNPVKEAVLIKDQNEIER